MKPHKLTQSGLAQYREVIGAINKSKSEHKDEVTIKVKLSRSVMGLLKENFSVISKGKGLISIKWNSKS